MNIKQAKEQIQNAIKAYFTKDRYGEYVLPIEAQRGCKETACEKRRIPGMGSSVDFCGAFGLWNTFCRENGCTNHILREFWIS